MYSITDFTHLGGLHFWQNTMERMNNAFANDADAMASFLGNKFVVTGCVDDGTAVSSGWIVVNGEKLPFVGGNKSTWVIIEEITGDESFESGTTQTVYFDRRAKFGVAQSGPNDFLYTELARLPFAATSLSDFMLKINRIMKDIIHFEPEVILDGCLVSNINTGSSTCDISEGFVLFNGKPVNSPMYTGQYPAYLKENGGWVTSQPSSGLFIKFDPHTSQRYKNVLDRAITPNGRIVMYETLSDRFDTSTGLGKWEMKGYKLVSAAQSRVPKGMWYDGIAVTNVTDANHTTPGNVGGEKTHQLSSLEQGSFTAKVKNDDTSGGGQNMVAQLNLGGTDVPNNGASNQGGYGTEITVHLSNATNAHNNEEPYIIFVYAKRED